MDVGIHKRLNYFRDVTHRLFSSDDETLPYTKVPRNVKEMFIINGYRHVECGFKNACLSLFRWHNETLNIWTHLCSVLYFVYYFALSSEFKTLVSDIPTNYLLPLYAYFIAVCFTFAASTGAHLFHCVSMSWYDTCFLVDYLGIGIYGCFTGMAYYYYNYWNLPRLLKELPDVYIAVAILSCLLSTWAACYSRLGHSPRRHVIRTSSFAMGFVVCSIPSVCRIIAHQYNTLWVSREDSISLAYNTTQNGHMVHSESQYCYSYLLHLMYFIIAASVNVLRIPECKFPGSFDIVASSHQWFHMFTFLGARERFWLITSDVVRYGYQLKNFGQNEEYVSMHKITGCYCIFTLSLVAILMWFIYKVKLHQSEKAK